MTSKRAVVRSLRCIDDIRQKPHRFSAPAPSAPSQSAVESMATDEIPSNVAQGGGEEHSDVQSLLSEIVTLRESAS